jgi:predicted SPOUT superfamily RNA methylase MTH1
MNQLDAGEGYWGYTVKMTWEELQAVKNHQHYDLYYEAN